MQIYSFSEAKQNFAAIFEQARQEGAVQIKNESGMAFILTPAPIQKKSPLDIEGGNLDLTAEEIVSFIHEGRDKSFII